MTATMGSPGNADSPSGNPSTRPPDQGRQFCYNSDEAFQTFRVNETPQFPWSDCGVSCFTNGN